MNGCRKPSKDTEHSYNIIWNDDVFVVDNIKICPSTSVRDVLTQIITKLACEYDQVEIEREFYKDRLQVSFMKYDQWYNFTNIEQLKSIESLKIMSQHKPLPAYFLQDFTGRYIFFTPPSPSDYEYLVCECIQMGNEMKCTTPSGVALKMIINSTPKCYNKWCNKDLASTIELNSCRCLLIRGEEGDVLAGYCSIKCAMEYRKETLEHMKQETLKSFRFLIRASRGDIRLMRILRGVHDRIEFSLRQSRSIQEAIQFVSYC